MYNIYSRCQICSKQSGCTEKSAKPKNCSNFIADTGIIDSYRPKSHMFTLKEISTLVGWSETTTRKYIKASEISSKYNYKDNSGSWSPSVHYYTYNIEEFMTKLNLMGKQEKASIIKDYIGNADHVFSSYICALSQGELLEVQLDFKSPLVEGNKQLFVKELGACTLLDVFDETTDSYTVLTKSGELKQYPKDIFVVF